MSATNALKAAMVTDLGGIAGIGTVSKEPVPIDSFNVGVSGGVYILSSEGGDELDSFNDQAGRAEQLFRLQLINKDDVDPNTDSDTLLDAVRNALEDQAATVGLVSGSGVVRVEQVTVVSWGPVESIEHIQAGWYIREADVSVIYYYERGSV